MKAVVLNVSAWMLLPLMDGLAKFLSQEIHFLQVVWGRYFFMALISLVITFLFFRHHLKWPSNFQIQLIRSLFLFLSTILFFYAISIISLPEALTLSFVSPMIVTLLSAIILKEEVGFRRWSAVVVGFIGVLFVIRPGFNEVNLATITALGCGICYAIYIISTRKLSNQDSPLLNFNFYRFIRFNCNFFNSTFLLVRLNFDTTITSSVVSCNRHIGSFFVNTIFKFCRSFKISAPILFRNNNECNNWLLFFWRFSKSVGLDRACYNRS